MILLARPVVLLAVTAIAFLTTGKTPGAVTIHNRELDRQMSLVDIAA